MERFFHFDRREVLELKRTIRTTNDVYNRIERMAKERCMTMSQMFCEMSRQYVASIQDMLSVEVEDTPEARAIWIGIWGDDKLFGIKDEQRILGILNPPHIAKAPDSEL
jgi:hypothetical protein